jgi:hypothetical protein
MMRLRNTDSVRPLQKTGWRLYKIAFVPCSGKNHETSQMLRRVGEMFVNNLPKIRELGLAIQNAAALNSLNSSF